jgi:hypothetical protein
MYSNRGTATAAASGSGAANRSLVDQVTAVTAGNDFDEQDEYHYRTYATIVR